MEASPQDIKNSTFDSKDKDNENGELNGIKINKNIDENDKNDQLNLKKIKILDALDLNQEENNNENLNDVNKEYINNKINEDKNDKDKKIN